MDAEILRLLTDTGKDATLVKVTSGAYDINNANISSSETNYPIKCHLVEYKDSVKDGTLIQQSDRKALIPAEGLAVQPAQEDKIISGSDTYKVINIQIIVKQNTNIAYVCQVRR